MVKLILKTTQINNFPDSTKIHILKLRKLLGKNVKK